MSTGLPLKSDIEVSFPSIVLAEKSKSEDMVGEDMRARARARGAADDRPKPAAWLATAAMQVNFNIPDDGCREVARSRCQIRSS